MKTAKIGNLAVLGIYLLPAVYAWSAVTVTDDYIFTGELRTKGHTQFYSDALWIGRSYDDPNSQSNYSPYLIEVGDDGATAVLDHSGTRNGTAFRWNTQLDTSPPTMGTGLSASMAAYAGVSHLDLWNTRITTHPAARLYTGGVSQSQNLSYTYPFETAFYLYDVGSSFVDKVRLSTVQDNYLANDTGIGVRDALAKLHVAGNTRTDGNATVNGQMTVTGQASFSQNATISGALQVNAGTTLTGPVSMTGALNAGTVNASGTLNATRINIGSGQTNWSVGGLTVGENNVASGYQNMLAGSGNTSNGTNNAIFGQGNVVESSTVNTFTWGSNNFLTKEASDSMAGGTGNIVLGSSQGVVAMGTLNSVGGGGAMAFGLGLINESANSVTVGTYNKPLAASAWFWVAADPVFVVGNGDSNTNRSNALVVTKSGNTGIGMGASTAVPAARLHVKGSTLMEGAASVTGNMTTAGNSSVTGNATVGGQMTVTGQAVFNQPVILQGAAIAGDVPMFGQ